MAISLAIGVQPRTAVDVFDLLRPQIIQSLFWRQRLPVAGAAAASDDESLTEEYAKLLAGLGDELKQLLTERRQAMYLIAKLRESNTL